MGYQDASGPIRKDYTEYIKFFFYAFKCAGKHEEENASLYQENISSGFQGLHF